MQTEFPDLPSIFQNVRCQDALRLDKLCPAAIFGQAEAGIRGSAKGLAGADKILGKDAPPPPIKTLHLIFLHGEAAGVRS